MPKAPESMHEKNYKTDALEGEGNRGRSQDLDERLDHGIKETFPGSDPVSVKVSKYAPGDPRAEQSGGEKPQAGQEKGVEGMIEQARGVAGDMAERVGEIAKDLSERHSMGPRVQRSRQMVEDAVRGNPLPALLLAGLIGCGVSLIAYEMISKPRGRKSKRFAYGADEIH